MIGHGHDHPHGSGRRNNGGASPRDKFLVSWRLSHDVFEKEIVNLISGRREIFTFQDWTDIVRDRQSRFLAKDFLNPWPHVLIAGIDERQVITHAEPWPRFGGGNIFGHLDDVRDRSAVRSPGQQNHVGA